MAVVNLSMSVTYSARIDLKYVVCEKSQIDATEPPTAHSLGAAILEAHLVF